MLACSAQIVSCSRTSLQKLQGRGSRVRYGTFAAFASRASCGRGPRGSHQALNSTTRARRSWLTQRSQQREQIFTAGPAIKRPLISANDRRQKEHCFGASGARSISRAPVAKDTQITDAAYTHDARCAVPFQPCQCAPASDFAAWRFAVSVFTFCTNAEVCIRPTAPASYQNVPLAIATAPISRPSFVRFA